MSKLIRRQKPLKGGRPSLHPCVEPLVESNVRRDMYRYGASKSFIVNVILAKHYGIKVEHY